MYDGEGESAKEAVRVAGSLADGEWVRQGMKIEFFHCRLDGPAGPDSVYVVRGSVCLARRRPRGSSRT